MSAVRGSRSTNAEGADTGPTVSAAERVDGGEQAAGGEPVAGGAQGAEADAALGSGRRSAQRASCCPFYHEAVELVGRRWTGAIIRVLMDRPMRFSEISHAVPELSDRLLSERMKELEARGIVERTVHPGPPVRVEYSLSKMGRELSPALLELQRWARRWLRSRELA